MTIKLHRWNCADCGEAHTGSPSACQGTPRLSVREHARRRGALDGADAQVLEAALTQAEQESSNRLFRLRDLEEQLEAAKAEIGKLSTEVISALSQRDDLCKKLNDCLDEKQPEWLDSATPNP